LFERLIAGVLLAAYKRRLRGIIEAAPGWIGERILSASERIDDKRMVPLQWQAGSDDLEH
jgi:hypothetical protein